MTGFAPESLRALRGYDRRSFLADLASGLTVGVIALPLAIGFGIASGVTPAQGLWTAIVAGFTSGIAVIIFTGQLNEFLGLGLKMPDQVPQQLAALFGNASLVNWRSVALGTITLVIVYGWPRISSKIPASIVAVIAVTLLAKFLAWDVATIGSKFGGIPSGLPGWNFPGSRWMPCAN
jgi:MFS superfamily sulfate permease-like transporter